MWNARLEKAQAGIKIADRIIKNLRNVDDTTLITESEEELKILLIKMKEESEKAGLKLNFQKTKMFIQSHHFMSNRWGNSGKTVTDFIFLGSKITADGDGRHEIKRHLLLGRKAMTNLAYQKAETLLSWQRSV